MSDDSRSGQPTKAYFQIDRPAHFRVRLDLLQELCVPESMARILPTGQAQYVKWLGTFGLAAEQHPFSRVQSFALCPYAFTKRYIVKCTVLPGRDGANSVIMDGRHWSSWCEYFGLFNSVIGRAVEFAVSHGMDEMKARAMFHPKVPGQPSAQCVDPHWGIGYEVASGLCTILALSKGETSRLYLDGEFGYYTPFQKETKPS